MTCFASDPPSFLVKDVGLEPVKGGALVGPKAREGIVFFSDLLWEVFH
ncbi:MAG: hypothetical protein A4E63_02983 [Syntrophorhabdus sp. PtaU1.Bin050]|nr:MAG: hypothetical protein A4E63_02983 [Syntrophorhabdus sp. PtaU1.Bin050]